MLVFVLYLLSLFPSPPSQPAGGSWVCAGNSYMMLETGWRPRPPQCQWVAE